MIDECFPSYSVRVQVFHVFRKNFEKKPDGKCTLHVNRGSLKPRQVLTVVLPTSSCFGRLEFDEHGGMLRCAVAASQLLRSGMEH